MPIPTDRFDYDLPTHLIAQTPAAHRDESRLLVVDRAGRQVSHHHFRDLPDFLRADDILFRNNAAVLPARLRAVRPTGGQVECFLLREEGDSNCWRCLVRPGRRLAEGSTFAAPDGAFTGRILERHEDGTALVSFTTPDNKPITQVANRVGSVPLPPYIERADDSRRAEDLERYQTVYAEPNRQVAVAAPTAGLHFTPELLGQLAKLGVGTADITLHVGLGTFRPIATETIEEHAIHRERYEIPETTQRSLLRPGGRRIAVGTTSVRTLEDFLRRTGGKSTPDYQAEADLFIRPPFTFQGVDALITNFHQPRSTLLCLVAAFLTPGAEDGIDWIREIYAEAIAREYRFFSYGDAMLIV